MIRRFTGWHMTAIMIGFFGTVIAVNVVMATDAIRTFGGEVVENSYVASQRYNRWLVDARAQQRLGWRAAAAVDRDGQVVVDLSGPAAAAPASVAVTVDHPLGAQPSRELVLERQVAGHYVSRERVGPGRWMLRILARSGGQEARFEQEVRL